MLLTSPLGGRPTFMGGSSGFGQRDGYTWLASPNLGAGSTCRVDATTVRGGDGSVWPDKASSYPACPAPNYQALQVALVQLSNVLNDSRINPGNTDGTLDSNGLPSDQVMGALVAALPHLRSKLGVYATTALTIALAFGASTTRAKQEVKNYMGPLAISIQAVAALKAGSAGSGGAAALGPLATPWYKTWWGAGGIGLGVVGIILLLRR